LPLGYQHHGFTCQGSTWVQQPALCSGRRPMYASLCTGTGRGRNGVRPAQWSLQPESNRPARFTKPCVVLRKGAWRTIFARVRGSPATWRLHMHPGTYTQALRYPRRDSNPHPTGSKPAASANWATRACRGPVEPHQPRVISPSHCGGRLVSPGLSSVAEGGIEPTRVVFMRHASPPRLPRNVLERLC
jgi:hypothetical protein